MDEIFIHNSTVVVFGDKTLTQRERPQLFIDAETMRIEDGKTAEIGEDALLEDDKKGQVVMTGHVETMA